MPKKPLFPITCPIIGITGEIASGKTLFALGINDDDATTLVYDLELGSETYFSQRPQLTHVNVMGEMANLKGAAWTPADLWLWWKADVVKRFSSGKYRVCIVDPVSELEEGLAQYIERQPAKFGLTANQIVNAPALKWGALKSEEKTVLAAIAGNCECFAYVVHLKAEWAPGASKPSSKRIPKGKTILRELATLELTLERKIIDGQMQRAPSARVTKDRLSVFKKVGGELVPIPVLPTFIKVCTPATIRKYMESPVGLRKLERDELVPAPAPLTEEEKAAQHQAIAEAEAVAATAKGEAADKELKLEQARAAIRKEEQARQAAPNGSLPSPAGRAVVENFVRVKVRADWIKLGNDYCKEVVARKIMSERDVIRSLEKRGATRVSDIPDGELEKFVRAVGHRLGVRDLEDALYGENH